MADEMQVMFCDYCIAASGQSDKNVFVKGCSNLKLESIKYHETSNSHLFATNKYKNSQQPTEAPAYKAKLSLNNAVYAMQFMQNLVFCLRLHMHSILKEGQPEIIFG